MISSVAVVPGTVAVSMIFLQCGQRRGALLGLHVAQIDLALRQGRRGVDGLAALHQADVDGDAALQVGQLVQGDDLVRHLADGADALLEVAARVGGLADDLEAPGTRRPCAT